MMAARIRFGGCRSGRARTLASALALLGIVLGAEVADGKDFCLDFALTADVGLDVVSEKFVVPKAGKCRAFVGRGNTNVYGANTVHGVACTTPSGDAVTFSLTLGKPPRLSAFDSGHVYFYEVRLALPTLEGEVTLRDFDDSTSVSGSAAHAFACVLKGVP